MQIARDQTKENFCEAIFNRHLNSQSICPANHEVSYHGGWFHKDDDPPFQCPEWTALADAMMRTKFYIVLYWPEGNCYVLGHSSDYEAE